MIRAFKGFAYLINSIWGSLIERVRYMLKIPYSLNVEIIQSPRRPRRTYVFVHGIGNTLHSWDEVYRMMPADVRIIGVDLLGFGDSPKPRRELYNAKVQARSVMYTLLKTPFVGRSVLVGHSLGALVSVEMARRYPVMFRELVLCSPPLYKSEDKGAARRFSREVLLRRLYRVVRKYPGEIERLSPIAVRMGLMNKGQVINSMTLAAYVSSLESSIINQTALVDITRLKTPITIYYGALDPLVIPANINQLAEDNKNIKVKKLKTGHEVVGGYAKKVAQALA